MGRIKFNGKFYILTAKPVVKTVFISGTNKMFKYENKTTAVTSHKCHVINWR